MLRMNGLLLYLMGLRKTRPAAGRFNPEEKFEYIGVFWGSIVLGTTGVLMWFHAWTTQNLPGRVLTIAILVHTMEAFLALLHVGIVHMAGVIFSPGVFPVSKAMFTGDTNAEELAEAHTGLLDDARKLLGGEPPKGAAHV
jgi:cytochrome b subunit of formate dehydrogenase